jgi:hypothetical protein
MGIDHFVQRLDVQARGTRGRCLVEGITGERPQAVLDLDGLVGAASKRVESGTDSDNAMRASPYRFSNSSDSVRIGSASVWARRYVVPMVFASSTMESPRAW